MISARSRYDARPNLVAEALASRRASGAPVLDLTESNPTRAGVPYAEDRIRRALSEPGALRYDPTPFGLPEARAAVARLWANRGVPIGADRVVLAASTSEAYSFLFKLLCDPGDRVHVPAPSYPLFEHLARYECVEVAPYRLEYDGAWYLDVESVAAAVTRRSRAVVVVSPNNPTGSYVKRDELERIAALGLPIISDEVFASYPLRDGGLRPCSALEIDGSLVFALDGLSKFALLPQMKLAWIALSGSPAAVSEALSSLELLLDTYLSPNVPAQHALPALLEASDVSRAHVRDRTRRNLEVLRSTASCSPLSVLDVEGGWYAVLRFPAVRTEEQWVLGLLGECGVLVQPGWFYDFRTEPFVVVSLLTPESVFCEGVRRLVDYARSDG